MLADPDLVWIGRRWGWFAISGLVVPFGLGWLRSGTLRGALTTFLWAGAVRMMLRRPVPTRDRSRNVAWLALISMGESFHNLHHAYPQSARHGALRHQPDPAAVVIRSFERLGWATNVHWPDPQRVAALRDRARRDPTTINPAPSSVGASGGRTTPIGRFRATLPR